MHYKEKLEMRKSIYNFYYFYRFELLRIVDIQTNNIFILANNNLANIEKKTIKSAKIIT